MADLKPFLFVTVCALASAAAPDAGLARSGHDHAHHDHSHAEKRQGRAAQKTRKPSRASTHAHRHIPGAPERIGPPHQHKHGVGAGHGAGHRHEPGAAHAHGVETENLFGFTLGSDTEEAGARGLAVENVGRIGKRAGIYRALGQKLEFAFGASDDLSLSFALLGDYHRLRNVPGLENVRGRYAFNGIGGEARWRFLDRKTSAFGLTLHLEPSLSRIDEVSGKAGRKIGSENKLVLDRELVPNTLFGALNILYDVERMKERHSGFAAERAANAGVGAALAYRITDALFIGGEARYLRAYDGFSLEKWQGQAFYLGPTVHARIFEKAWLSAAWNIQVAGREAVNRADRAATIAEFNEAVAIALAAGAPLPPLPNLGRRGRCDLANFDRHQFKLKAGFEF